MSMPMRSRSARVVLVAVLAIAVGACSKTLDTEGLEGQLATQIEDEIDTTITSVECPEDVDVESGATFTCTAEEESGAALEIQVTQSDDQGNVEWELVDASA
jgi:Domain of unknown function (DUF4333)